MVGEVDQVAAALRHQVDRDQHLIWIGKRAFLLSTGFQQEQKSWSKRLEISWEWGARFGGFAVEKDLPIPSPYLGYYILVADH
jgi:hypothetical protein